MKALLLGLLGCSVWPLALAHDGHGLASPHWHATDTLGYLLLGAVVAAALWASRRR